MTNKGKGIIISPELQPSSGGYLLSNLFLDYVRSNYKICHEIHVPAISGKLNKLIHYIKNDIVGLSKEVEAQIIEVINDKDILYVFFNHSFFGDLSRKIKSVRPDIKIITFFHNVESAFAYDSFMCNRNPGHYLFYKRILSQEKELVSLSDKIIVLNDRDNCQLKKLYGRGANAVIPIAIEDKFIPHNNSLKRPFNQKYSLFVGSAFYANIHGLRWFIKEVAPYISYPLIIVGKGLDEYRLEFERNPNIIVKGFVEDLSSYYQFAHVVISPIFKGSGMKTKTAEALMYGKSIIGTNEAFEGFRISSNVGKCCNTSKDFIEVYNNTDFPLYNEHSRSLYTNFHSVSAFEHSLSKII